MANNKKKKGIRFIWIIFISLDWVQFTADIIICSRSVFILAYQAADVLSIFLQLDQPISVLIVGYTFQFTGLPAFPAHSGLILI